MAQFNIYSDINLHNGQLKMAKAEHLETLPTASEANKGRLVYVDDKLHYCSGTTWIPLTQDTDTHSTSHLYAGATGATAPGTVNEGGATFITVADETAGVKTARDSVEIVGEGYAKTSVKVGQLKIYVNVPNATTSVRGLMSAEDKTKLDGLENTEVDTTVTANSTNPVESRGVKDYVDATVNSAISDVNSSLAELGNALTFKGTIGPDGSGATVSALPATHKVGDTYQVKANGLTLNGEPLQAGDMVVCVTAGTTASETHWNAVNSNWTATDGTSQLAWGTAVTLATVGGVTIDAKLPANPNTDTKVTSAANHYAPTEDTASKIAVADASTGKVISEVKRDAKGHITGVTTTQLANATTNASGLMSGADKTKLDGLTAGATKNVTYSAPLTGSSASITLATMGMSSVDHVQTFVGDDLVLMETKVTSTGVSWASTTAFSASSNAKIVVTGR